MTSYIHHIPGRVRVRVARVKGSLIETAIERAFFGIIAAVL